MRGLHKREPQKKRQRAKENLSLEYLFYARNVSKKWKKKNVTVENNMNKVWGKQTYISAPIL
jgi:hypothetical protein